MKRSPDEPTGRANARPMINSATSGLTPPLRRPGSDIGNAAHNSEKQDRVAQHAAPMQPPQPANRGGVAGIPGAELGIPLPEKPAARPDCESRDQSNANRENWPASHGKDHRPDRTGNARHQKMSIEHTAQELGDLWNVELHQQKGGRRQKKVTHREK